MFKISVIICTYNREKYIYNVLKSLAINDFPKEQYEIVLVNNNCTDHTEAECRRFQNDFPEINFRLCLETNQGLSYARNHGINSADGEVLVYVDDDALVNRTYLKTYADFFAKNPSVEAAGGPVIPQYETQEPRWLSHYTRQLVTGKLYLGAQEKKFPKGIYPGGGNAAYRKRVFEKVGLFNVELGRKGDSLIGAEEKDLFDKMTTQNIHFFYLPSAVLYHIIPETKLSKSYFQRLSYSIGKSERLRTLSISKSKYFSRIFSEGIKWAASLLLWCFYVMKGQTAKGNAIIIFRYYVSKGLINGKM